MADEIKLIDLANKQTTEEDVILLREQEWYKHFSEELRAEIVETEFGIHTTAIKLNHSIGKQITEKIGDFDRAKIYGKSLIQTLAEDVMRSRVGLYKAVQFYKAVPNLDEWLPKQPKNLSWYRIAKDLPSLTEAKEKGEEPTISPEKEAPVPPEIHFVWNDQVKLWDIKIAEEDMEKVNLLGFKKEIEDYFDKKAQKTG